MAEGLEVLQGVLYLRDKREEHERGLISWRGEPMGVVSQLWGTLLLSFFMQILDNSTTPNLWWYSLKELEEDNSRKQLRYSKNPCLVQVK